MKLFGKQIDKPKPSTIVLSRNDEFHVFQCEAVLDYAEFERLCPKPRPDKLLKPGGQVLETTDSPRYTKALEKWGNQRLAWMIIQSLKNTPGLTWDKVNYDDPETWLQYEDELKEAYFSQVEINELVGGVIEANNLSQEKIREARDRFFRMQSETAEK